MFLKPWLEMRIPKMARSRWMCSTSPSMDTSGIHCQTQKILQNTSWEHARLHDHWKRKYQSVSSITQSCPSLYDPLVAASQASLSITNSQSLFKLMSIESVMPSNHLILLVPFSSYLQSFPESGSFPRTQFFASGGQSTGVSASASVLPVNIQDWFPLGLVESPCNPRDSQESSKHHSTKASIL